ncbi:MAG: hypothetical protein ABIP51_00500 [Bacteroidia bacterium]
MPVLMHFYRSEENQLDFNLQKNPKNKKGKICWNIWVDRMESDYMEMDGDEYPGGDVDFYSIKAAEEFLYKTFPDLKELTEEDL